LQSFGSHEFSDIFKSRINKLIILSRKPYFLFINSTGRKVAAILVIFAFTLSTVMIRVEAVRRPVFQFFTEIYEEFSSVIFPNAGEDFPEKIEKIYEPKYTPEGYVLSEVTELTVTVQYVYSNNIGDELIFMQYVISSNILNADNVDIQKAFSEKIIVGRKEALFYSVKNVNNLIWTDNGYGYQINGWIQKEEMIKMMESVQLKNKQ
jgi:hypothetical protein